jgi:hypothetical protein
MTERTLIDGLSVTAFTSKIAYDFIIACHEYGINAELAAIARYVDEVLARIGHPRPSKTQNFYILRRGPVTAGAAAHCSADPREQVDQRRDGEAEQDGGLSIQPSACEANAKTFIAALALKRSCGSRSTNGSESRGRKRQHGISGPTSHHPALPPSRFTGSLTSRRLHRPRGGPLPEDRAGDPGSGAVVIGLFVRQEADEQHEWIESELLGELSDLRASGKIADRPRDRWIEISESACLKPMGRLVPADSVSETSRH